MDSRNAQVGWTDAQWNRVREEVLREWQRTRVAGSFLPIYGPLPPSTQVVPSERIKKDGSVDDAETLRVFQLSVRVPLSRQQISEDDLSDAILAFRRAATALALAEDVAIFNGQDPVTPDRKRRRTGKEDDRDFITRENFRPVDFYGGEPHSDLWHLRDQLSKANPKVSEPEKLDADDIAALTANRSPLGLVDAASADVYRQKLAGEELVSVTAQAVTRLSRAGYGPPFVCVLRSSTFAEAYSPLPQGLVLPADRMEPLLGRALLRSTALDQQPTAGPVVCGVVLSLAGDGVDLAVAVDATPEFTFTNAQGKYEFQIFERFALRVKDNRAILRLLQELSLGRADVGEGLIHKIVVGDVSQEGPK